MTYGEKMEVKTSIERKIKSTESAIVEYRDMTQPVAPDVADKPGGKNKKP